MSVEFYTALVKHFEPLEHKLNQLDAAVGDGDHGTSILKGLRAVLADPESGAPAKLYRRAAGGASGSLFSVVVGGIDQVLKQEKDLSEALTESATKITQIGQAVAGDKTMLDALLPAAAEKTPQSSAVAARAGADATVEMAAKRGRAKYVEGAGVGHIDAGAVSVAEILSVFAHYCSSTDNTAENHSSST